jgi:hypothetical protein
MKKTAIAALSPGHPPLEAAAPLDTARASRAMIPRLSMGSEAVFHGVSLIFRLMQHRAFVQLFTLYIYCGYIIQSQLTIYIR